MDENQETKENIPTSDEASLSKTQVRLVHFMKELFEGEIVSFDFFYRKWKACLILLILLFCYIGNRYSCHRKMAEIERLRTRETELRYEATTLSSELTGVSRINPGFGVGVFQLPDLAVRLIVCAGGLVLQLVGGDDLFAAEQQHVHDVREHVVVRLQNLLCHVLFRHDLTAFPSLLYHSRGWASI